MKVGTDSLLFGSWLAYLIDKHRWQLRSALDIGSGSGLLSLMLAQATCGETAITAVEVDALAYRQSLQNIGQSPWPTAITVAHQDFRSFAAGPVGRHEERHMFDVIFSNPPYFIGAARKTRAFDHQSDGRMKARSQTSLPLNTLLLHSLNMLSTAGFICLVLPHGSAVALLAAAEGMGLYLHSRLDVRATPTKAVQRVCLCLSRSHVQVAHEEINIYQQNGVYTQEYKALCKSYYKHF
ncbi:tRNA1(Val) (adenine(37)-N6)-methyltransferase [Alteromonas oceanisediminis]|uniref:tRNA1(Val) (adenine(37)-N6)-methyltransferase n=1 Tax=Alteromonas oceanisediminis TaxID=2836180 RepID=UPI001BD9AFFF|nr:methyltransferase [Alteromonas oceanisediminis]MBT0585888.1 methyltransferase [Alteromonas oceanisediminis]